MPEEQRSKAGLIALIAFACGVGAMYFVHTKILESDRQEVSDRLYLNHRRETYSKIGVAPGDKPAEIFIQAIKNRVVAATDRPALINWWEFQCLTCWGKVGDVPYQKWAYWYLTEDEDGNILYHKEAIFFKAYTDRNGRKRVDPLEIEEATPVGSTASKTRHK